MRPPGRERFPPVVVPNNWTGIPRGVEIRSGPLNNGAHLDYFRITKEVLIHKVTKEIHFCYGHRLLDYEGKCQHLHGHNAIAEIEIASQTLDDRGMVVDFGEINQIVKTWIDSELDHTMLLCKRDPVLNILQELKEPCFVMEENPTAENIARVIYEYAESQGLPVAEVRLWETPTSYATYRK